ncbi:MAG: Gfo/Idh/MocA family protein [Candidatus Nanopelagicales bacterium]
MNSESISRILIVGKGSMGLRHINLSRRFFPNAEIKTLNDRVSTSHIDLTDGYFETIEQSQKFAPQIAIIANPATFHYQIAKKLAEVGTHLLIEKPISTTTEHLIDLITLCKEKNLILMTGYNLRFSPTLIYFNELIKKKIVGQILSVRCEVGQYLPDWRPNKDYRKTVSANFHLGGGVLLELSHEIDYLRWIFGEINWVRATLSKQSSLEIDVEDSAHLIFGFKPKYDGHQIISNLNLDFVRHDRTRTCTAIGEKGTLRWDGVTNTVNVYDQQVRKWTEVYKMKLDNDETFVSEWKNFIDSVNSRRQPHITGVDGLRVLEVIEAARKSAPTGNQINVTHNIVSIPAP